MCDNANEEKMKQDKSIERIERRYQSLADKLAKTGPILQGTITERTVKGDKDKKQKPGESYGPYYQWTFKRVGKTVTVNLTKEQARLYQKAIDQNRKVEEILKEMKELSEEILEARTQGVKKRKSRK